MTFLGKECMKTSHSTSARFDIPKVLALKVSPVLHAFCSGQRRCGDFQSHFERLSGLGVDKFSFLFTAE